MVIVVNFSNKYYKELHDITDKIDKNIEERDRFIRRREMAKHSMLNSESFTNRVTEGEDNVISALKSAIEQKTRFDKFTKEEWENNTILLEDINQEIIDWCFDEFGYKPYIMGGGWKKYL